MGVKAGRKVSENVEYNFLARDVLSFFFLSLFYR